MAVVPDRRIAITHKLKMLRTNKAIVTAALEKILSTKASETGTASDLKVSVNQTVAAYSKENRNTPLH